MSRTRHTNRPGFTLLELLVVMAIIIALFALLLPTMMSRQEKSRINQADIKVKQFENDLELYATENRGYPTTEQGLMALLYIPDNAGLARSTLMQQQGVQTGVPGMDGTGGFGAGEAPMVGGDPMNPMAPMTGVQPDPMGGIGGGLPNTGAPGGIDMTGATDPMLGGGVPGMTDPMNSGMTGGAVGGWTQPFYNPAIYTQLRKRPQPYVEKEQDLTDPWGMPYRYENNLQYNGLNRTGTAKPAIWSAGPDKLDDTEDDIRNWVPADAQLLISQRQQQVQGGGMGGTMGNPMDPMNPMQSNPMDPMNPMQPNVTDPMNPMQPNAPMPMTPMPTTPMPTTPMPATPMPNAPMPTTPMPNAPIPQPPATP